MTRENRSLQVAVIIFAMLTLLLGVTTFIFSRNYRQAVARADAVHREVLALRNLAAERQAETDELKRLIGLPHTATLDTVRKLFARDMQTHAGGVAKENRFYRPTLAQLSRLVHDQRAEQTQLRAEILYWKDRYAVRERGSKGQIDEFDRRARDADGQLLIVQRTSRREHERNARGQEDMHRRMIRARNEAEQTATDLQQQITGLKNALQKAQREVKSLENKIKKHEPDSPVIPDGIIRQVNYRLKTAWIDLGRADGLLRHVGFDVYAGDAPMPLRGQAKGKIEVSRVVDDHLAEARVTDEALNAPILRGDYIESPHWSRVQR